jgi:quercetin dioxygenase-like cupin family protein
MERRNFLATGAMGGISILNLVPIDPKKNDRKAVGPFYIPPSKPLVHGMGNVDVRTIIHSNQTNKQISNVEVAVAPKQMGPTPHIHKDLDELMYVLEGTATVMIGKEIYEVKEGGWNFRPHGIVHSFWNSQDTPLRFIDFFFNQNFEDYLDVFFHKIIPDMLKKNLNPTSPEIAKRFDELDKEYGVTYFHDQRQVIIENYRLNG